MAFDHGGQRENQTGRPKGATTNRPAAAARRQYEEERALHEKVKREQREFDFAVARGAYLPRAAQQSAAATALAILTQSLRSLPDQLERTQGLAPETAEALAVGIDEALAELALAFKAMTLPQQ